jgi:type IV secretion system protein VirD4
MNEIPLWERALVHVGATVLNRVRPYPQPILAQLLATTRDLRACGLLETEPVSAFTLAAWNYPELRGAYAGPLLCDGSRHPHLLVSLPSGGGKTLSIIAPSLASTWTGSAVSFDPKSELHRLTAVARARLGPVYLFRPGTGEGARYNPLDHIRPGHLIPDAKLVAEHLAPEPGDAAHVDPYWRTHALAYLSAVLVFMLDTAPPEERTLAGVASALARGAELGDAMKANEHPDPAARKFIREGAARLWNNPSEKTVGSVVSQANAWTAPFAEPGLAASTATSDFKLSDLMCAERPVSLYLASSPTDLPRTAPLLRVLLAQLVAELMAHEGCDREGQEKQHRLGWFLDELPLLGRIGALERVLPIARSMGHRFCLGVQSIAQLRAVYGEHSTAFTGNCRLVTGRQLDPQEAERISRMVGEAIEIKRTASRSWSWRGGESRGESGSESWRAALPPADVLRLPDDRLLIFGEARLILAHRTPPAWWLADGS